MNDEIKEIYFNDWKWIRTHDNMGGVMGNVVFKDNIIFEEYKKMFENVYFVLCSKDYITNLQEENEALYETAEQHSKVIDRLQQENERLKENLQQEKKDFKEANDYCFELKDYKSRCEKAIKYIDTNFCIENRRDLKEVVNILQNGSEKDG